MRSVFTVRAQVGHGDRAEIVVDFTVDAPGGIVDIEFMVQYAVLRWACEQPRLPVWTDNLRTLEIIADLGLWEASTCSALHDAYFAMRAEIHRSTLQQADGVVDVTGFEQHRSRVMAIWNSVFA